MYARDLAFTNTARKLITEQLYPRFAVSQVSIGGSLGSEWVQQNAHIDAILALKDGRSITVEEKIIRRPWPSFALETWSSVERERPGWIYTSKADWLLYAFIQPYGMDAYLMEFDKLQGWFNRVQAAIHYHPHDTENKMKYGDRFTSRCILVPIDELSRAIRVVKYKLESES